MSWSDIFSHAAQKKMGCPIRIRPKCHPRGHADVYVNGDKRKITVCCSVCDRPMFTAFVPHQRKKHDKRTGPPDAGKGQ